MIRPRPDRERRETELLMGQSSVPLLTCRLLGPDAIGPHGSCLRRFVCYSPAERVARTSRRSLFARPPAASRKSSLTIVFTDLALIWQIKDWHAVVALSGTLICFIACEPRQLTRTVRA